MGRTARGYWDARRKVWLCRLGEISPVTGKARPVVLRHEDGRPVGRSDQRGRLQAIDRLLARRDDRTYAGPSVAEVCAGFLGWLRSRGKADRTIEGYDYHLRRWVALVGPHRAAASITEADLWAWEEAGGKCVRQTQQAVKAAFGWAARPIRGRVPARVLEVNPFAGFEVEASRPTERALPWKDARRVLRLAWGYARAPARARIERTRASRRLRWACVAVIAHAGLRPGECWGMRWDEWHPEAGMFLPDPARIKTRRFRPVPLPPRLAALIEGLRPISDATYCFRDRASRAREAPDPRELFRWVREELKPWLRAWGCRADWTLYALRHGFFTDGVASGVSAEELALAGANSPEVIRARYLSVQAEMVRRTAEKVRRGRRGRG